MSKKSRRRADMVSIRDYVDTRFASEGKAVVLALETVKVAMERDDRRLSSVISIVALVVSVAVGVYEIAKHT